MLSSCSRNALRTTQKLSKPRAAASTSFCQPQNQCRRASQHNPVANRRAGEDGSLPRLRAQPFAFSMNGQAPKLGAGSPLAKSNLLLGRDVDRGSTAGAFKHCADMKAAGIKPNIVTYERLLLLCARNKAMTDAWAIFEDMLCMDIRPDREIFHHLLKASASCGIQEAWAVLDMMARHDVSPNQTTYEILILRLLDSDNLELSLRYIAEMNVLGLSPTLKTMQTLIRSAARLGLPRLAVELAESFERTSIRRLEVNIWMECLISSASSLYAEGVTRAWEQVVHKFKILPDEGCCIAVLNTAARHSLPDLGMDVIRVLGDMKVTWQEHHFAAVVEAFSKTGNIKEAFLILDLMRTHGILPVAETAHPIFLAIKANYDQVDDAWGILETLHEDGKTIDVTALNVIVLASVSHGDLQRAVGTYKAFPDLNVTPSVDTFNYLLTGCVTARHRELGDKLLSEMRDMKIKPDQQTYETMITLCLTQPTYEDAFFYLEEMKAEGHLPPQTVYEAIIKKCVSVGDTRYHIAIEEMKEKGYEMTKRTKHFVDSGGERSAPEGGEGEAQAEGEARRPQPSSRGASRKRKDFVDQSNQ